MIKFLVGIPNVLTILGFVLTLGLSIGSFLLPLSFFQLVDSPLLFPVGLFWGIFSLIAAVRTKPGVPSQSHWVSALFCLGLVFYFFYLLYEGGRLDQGIPEFGEGGKFLLMKKGQISRELPFGEFLSLKRVALRQATLPLWALHGLSLVLRSSQKKSTGL